MSARHEIVTDPKAMTITVGPRVYDRPQLARTPELHTRVKEEVCGHAPWGSGPKAVHQHFAAILGAKFNRRFQAANYWLWVGNRMTRRTADLLRHEGKHWHQYSDDLVWSAHLALPYVREAEEDGLLQLIPPIVTFRDSPQSIRRKIGQGAWRRVANNSISRNRLIMHATLRARRADTPPDPALFVRLLEFPSGVLRYVQGATGDEIIAARIVRRKRGEAFQQALHMVMDTRRMVGRAFNPRWSYARMAEEHDRATKESMRGRFSERRFADDWHFERDGFSASLLTSPFEIAAEGATQHHCVGSYAHLAKNGQYAIFKIEGKERATASLLLDGTARPDQIYAACNGAVSIECRAFASQLAAEYGALLRSAA